MIGLDSEVAAGNRGCVANTRKLHVADSSRSNELCW